MSDRFAGEGVFLEAVISHFCLLNFAVSAVLSLQSSRTEPASSGSLGKISLILFIAGAGAATLTLLRLGLSPEPKYFSARWLILATAMAWLSIAARIWLKVSGMLSYSAPLVTLLLLLQLLAPPGGHGLYPTDPENLFLACHVAGATMGQILALQAGLVAVLYLWQQSLLKRKLLDQLTSRVPSLELLEKILVASLWAGFLFLTAALISGTIYFRWYFQGSLSHYGEKVAWAVTVWLCYLAALLARDFFNISTKRVAQISLLGFLLLAMAFFGLSFYERGSW